MHLSRFLGQCHWDGNDYDGLAEMVLLHCLMMHWLIICRSKAY